MYEIDFVYTWVDGSDENWLREKELYLKNATNRAGTTINRFRDNEELRYSLRSLEKYVDFYNHVYIITNGQVPYWLNTKSKKITIIDHKDIYPDKTHLPTFNSNSIETHLHRIPNLKEHFVYLNDDFHFARKIKPKDFFKTSKNKVLHVLYTNGLAMECSPGCKKGMEGDGYCDAACNTQLCSNDGGDCNQLQNPSCAPGCDIQMLNGPCNSKCNVPECFYNLGRCRMHTEWRKNTHEINATKGKTTFSVVENDRLPLLINFPVALTRPQYLVKSNGAVFQSLHVIQENCIVIIFKRNYPLVNNVEVTVTLPSGVYKVVAKYRPVGRADVVTLNTLVTINEIEKSDSVERLISSSVNKPVLHKQTTNVLNYFNAIVLRSSKVLDDAYGIVRERTFPYHVPNPMTKTGFSEMCKSFPEETQKTSSQRFRSLQDLQVGFFYANFIRDSKEACANLVDKPTNEIPEACFGGESTKQRVINACGSRKNCKLFKKHFLPKEKTQKFQYVAHNPHNGYVEIIGDHNYVRKRLRSIYMNRPKFVCFNDNKPHDSFDVDKEVKYYFNKMFPEPSVFERQNSGDKFAMSIEKWWLITFFTAIICTIHLVSYVKSKKKCEIMRSNVSATSIMQ